MEKSLKIYNEKIRTDDKVYERLYKKRTNKENLFKSPVVNKKHVTSRSHVEKSVNNLYGQYIKKNEKLKELENKVIIETSFAPISSLHSSNKIILIKFINEYNEATKHFGMSINFHEMILLFGKLNLISRKKELEEIIFQNINNNDFFSSLNDLKIFTEDKKLSLEVFEIMKDNLGLVPRENLFIFLVCIINLYDYYLLKTNNIKTSIETNSNYAKKKDKNQDLNSSVLSKKEIKENALRDVDQDITKKIIINKKFIGYDEKGNLCINLHMANLIHKHFGLLSINYFSKENQTANENTNKAYPFANPQNTFKPNTNPNSDKLSTNFRKKIKAVSIDLLLRKLKI
jgi:hypothetical protein